LKKYGNNCADNFSTVSVCTGGVEANISFSYGSNVIGKINRKIEVKRGVCRTEWRGRRHRRRTLYAFWILKHYICLVTKYDQMAMNPPPVTSAIFLIA
jgi:hypothetical protein